MGALLVDYSYTRWSPVAWGPRIIDMADTAVATPCYSPINKVTISKKEAHQGILMQGPFRTSCGSAR
ncbi:hypothetical protein TNCV_3892331 [Trichonephila clavipes]|nr:hypothetical protein TNCV_3892331 [Trichonephila clavipes]